MHIEIGDEVEVEIEVPRGSLVKWRTDGSIDFVSPLPCPFNYGSVVGSIGPDGDPIDALILGPILPRGRRTRWRVRGVVHFVDDGLADPKWVCAAEPPTEAQWRRVHRFFAVYAVAKRVLNRVRGRHGWTGLRDEAGP